jgi:hypothetical protein
MSDAARPPGLLLLIGTGGTGDRREANPTALSTVVDLQSVDAQRNVSCAEYDACLDAALRHRWASFTCSRCALFSAAKASRSQELDRQAGLRPFGSSEGSLAAMVAAHAGEGPGLPPERTGCLHPSGVAPGITPGRGNAIPP